MTNEQRLREALQELMKYTPRKVWKVDGIGFGGYFETIDPNSALAKTLDRCDEVLALTQPVDEGTPETPLTDEVFDKCEHHCSEVFAMRRISRQLERTLNAKERELHEKRMELVGANASIRQLNQMLEWKDKQLATLQSAQEIK